jgi:spermidine/putrescine transport system substrate-binding protein
MDNRSDFSGIDPALLRGLTQSRFSRRDMLRYAGMGAGAIGLSAFLAACSTGSTSTPGAKLPNSGMGTASWWSQQKSTGQMTFANWPYYIDVSHGQHPSINLFTKQTGIKVTYDEVIQDNTSFYQKIKPSLQSGQSIGYDIVVLTNNSPVLGEVMNAGWLIPLDHSAMPNFDKYAGPLIKNPSWDPGNKYTMAWQSGYTSIAYNTDHIKTPITSLNSLWDTKYKGLVAMPSDPQELGTMGLLVLGIEPATSTQADWQKAAQKLQQQKDAGIVRAYSDQSYIQDLKNGNTWLSWCWSGDIFQANLSGFTNLKMVIPTEGSGIWTDNMCMPYTATNTRDAMTYMDFVYDPNVQAMIEGYDNYVCPVPASQAIMEKSSNPNVVKAAHSPTVFPTAAMIKLSKPYYQYKNQQELQTWNNLFLPIIQG